MAGLNVFVLLALVLLLSVHHVRPKIVRGEINTRADWAFVTRFCFKDSYGQMQYKFEYPQDYEVQNILLYFDTQWPKAYPQHGMDCKDREDKLYIGNNQVINLTIPYIWSGCAAVQIPGNNIKTLTCTGDRRFLSIRARWWYIAVSNCKSTKGLRLKYFLNLTNGNTFWNMHFSADEREIIKMDIVFFILFLFILILAVYLSFVLIDRRLFHYTYKLFLVSLLSEVISLAIYIGYYVDYGQTGISKYVIQVTARAFHYGAHVIFLLLLILLAKGWTVTRGRISSSGQIKLSAFCTLYAVCFAVLFIFEAVVFDPGQVLYIYESPAGIGLSVLRVIAWLWFCYGTFFTLKHYPNKAAFYYPFWFFYSAWFLAGPVIVVIATFVITTWAREQVVNGIEWSVSLLAHLFFLIITRPVAANKNFPFHIRTNQIGIINMAYPPQIPGTQSAVPAINSYSPAYPPPMYSQATANFTDIASMFIATSQGKQATSTPHGLYRNGINNTSTFNGSYPMTATSSPSAPSSSPQ